MAEISQAQRVRVIKRELLGLTDPFEAASTAPHTDGGCRQARARLRQQRRRRRRAGAGSVVPAV
jgi:hypothetical protein